MIGTTLDLARRILAVVFEGGLFEVVVVGHRVVVAAIRPCAFGHSILAANPPVDRANAY